MVYSGFTQMLTGVDLLAKVKDLGDVSKTDLATQCGYVSQKKDGSDRVNFTAFYEALLNAKGIDLGGGAGGIGKGGRKLSYIAKVQGNGNLLIGKAYTAMLELNPGDNFTIKGPSNGKRSSNQCGCCLGSRQPESAVPSIGMMHKNASTLMGSSCRTL